MDLPKEIIITGTSKIIITKIPQIYEKYICNICSSFAKNICSYCHYPKSPGCNHYPILGPEFCEKCKEFTPRSAGPLAKDIKKQIITKCKYSINGCRKEISLVDRLNHMRFCLYDKKGKKQLLLIAKFFKKKKPSQYNLRYRKVFTELTNFNLINKRIPYLTHQYFIKLFQFELQSTNSTSCKMLYKVMKYMSNIVSINFDNLRFLPKDEKIMIAALNFPKNLGKITFSYCELTTKHFGIFSKSWKQLEKVQELKLINSILPKRGDKYFNEFARKCKKVSLLEFEYLTAKKDSNDLHLSKFLLSFLNSKTIQELKLTYTRIQPNQLATLISSLENLKLFKLEGHNFIIDSKSHPLTVAFQNHKRIESLEFLDYSKIFSLREIEIDFFHLIGLSNLLKRIHIKNHCSLNSFCNFIQGNNILEEIYLIDFDWDEEGIEHFSERLKLCKFLKILDLSNQHLNKDPDKFYFGKLANGLIYCNSIQFLIMKNYILKKEVFPIISLIVKNCDHLTGLDMTTYYNFEKGNLDELSIIIKEKGLNVDNFKFMNGRFKENYY